MLFCANCCCGWWCVCLIEFDDGDHKMNISKFSRFFYGTSYVNYITSRKICISRYSPNRRTLQPTTKNVILRKYQSNSGPPAEIYRGMVVVASKLLVLLTFLTCHIFFVPYFLRCHILFLFIYF